MRLCGVLALATCGATGAGALENTKFDYASLPSNVKESEYAVRGEIVLTSQAIQKKLDSGNHSYKFKRLIPCNIGNPQAVGQKPLTFHREILSLLTNPALMDDAAVTKKYPSDVLDRAQLFTKAAGNFGAYSTTKGVNLFREYIAEYVDRRDGHVQPKPDIDDIFITDGASQGIKTILEMLIRDKKDVVLIPIPQYPLYSASVTRLGGTWVGYELAEDYTAKKPSWGFDAALVEKLIQEAKENGQTVRAIAVINPGNPTGNILSHEDIEAVVALAEKYSLVILADEVYQENVYSPTKKFISFRQVVHEQKSSANLASFMSISKGYYGECGLRGGYMHLTNIDKDVSEEVYKLMSMTLCSNTLGQAMMASIVNPPQTIAEPSYTKFAAEKKDILDGLRKKGDMVYLELNSIPGVDCMPIEGAMYAFPQVQLPKKYVDHARKLGKEPDTLYCLELLEVLGVIMVPGNGFAQRPGTFHYRMTILPPEEDLKYMLSGLRKFQEDLYTKYGDIEDDAAMCESNGSTTCGSV